jgi:hypothetical protein
MNWEAHILFELLELRIDEAIGLCAQNIGLLKLIFGVTQPRELPSSL